jgi:hypothetical protein
VRGLAGLDRFQLRTCHRPSGNYPENGVLSE